MGTSLSLGLVENQLGDVFRGWVLVQQVEWLAHFFEHGDHWVATAKDHAMVQVLVDPGAYRLLDVAEIQHHPPRVQLRSFNADHGPTVVAMQVTALAIVVQQPMP